MSSPHRLVVVVVVGAGGFVVVVGLGGGVVVTTVVVVTAVVVVVVVVVVVDDVVSDVEIEPDGRSEGVLMSETVTFGVCREIVTSMGVSPSAASGSCGPATVRSAARAAPMSAPIPRRPCPLIPTSTRTAYLVHSIGSSGTH